MQASTVQDRVESILRHHYADPDLTVNLQPVSGGDINLSFRAEIASKAAPATMFVKANHGADAATLVSEYQALHALRDFRCRRYPNPRLYDHSPEVTVLLMDYYQLTPLDDTSAADLGRLLAEQHRVVNDRYGWQQNNHIGRTVQLNAWSSNWIEFFRDQRLLPQLSLAKQNNLGAYAIGVVEDIMSRLQDYLDADTSPSLLHGDLWGGNAAFDHTAGAPLMYDPAPYFGDRDVDLAMTRLFGGFPRSFYDAYHEIFPQTSQAQVKHKIYNLYHALNHFNMFGAGYESMIRAVD